MLDPRNPSVKYNRGPAAISSFLDVRDRTARLRRQAVPHGKVEMRFYDSKTTGLTRRIHVYTPPNYERMNARLPVLYLLMAVTAKTACGPRSAARTSSSTI